MAGKSYGRILSRSFASGERDKSENSQLRL
jgi:hypothetical protein